jgi:hypothetical protein
MMTRYAALAVVAGLFVWTSAAQTQEAIIIKMKTREQGDVILVTKNGSVTTKIKVEDANGNVVVDKSETKVEISAYKETVYQRKGTKPATKVERAYTKCQLKTDDDTEVLDLQGKTVIIEKQEDMYTYTYKGGEAVTGAAEALLAKEWTQNRDSNAELEKLMLPKAAVKPGESWKLDVAPILDNLFKGSAELEFHNAKATGTGKLAKAYMKGGRQFGELHYKLVVPLKSMGKVPTQRKFDDGSKMTLELTMDVCIDGTSEAGTIQARMSLLGTSTADDSILRLDIRSVMSGTQADPAKK